MECLVKDVCSKKEGLSSLIMLYKQAFSIYCEFVAAEPVRTSAKSMFRLAFLFLSNLKPKSEMQKFDPALILPVEFFVFQFFRLRKKISNEWRFCFNERAKVAAKSTNSSHFTAGKLTFNDCFAISQSSLYESVTVFEVYKPESFVL